MVRRPGIPVDTWDVSISSTAPPDNGAACSALTVGRVRDGPPGTAHRDTRTSGACRTQAPLTSSGWVTSGTFTEDRLIVVRILTTARLDDYRLGR